jgi:ELWxxDGT repeat protein
MPSRYLGLVSWICCIAAAHLAAPTATWAQPFAGKQLVKVVTDIDQTRYVSSATPTKNFIILETSVRLDPFASGFSLFYTTGTPNNFAPLVPTSSGILKHYRYIIKPNLDTVYFSGETLAKGVELYKIDVGASTPTLVADFEPGGSSSYPKPLFFAGDNLIFLRYN